MSELLSKIIEHEEVFRNGKEKGKVLSEGDINQWIEQRITAFLTSDQQITSLSIVGLPGGGKTSLVKRVRAAALNHLKDRHPLAEIEVPTDRLMTTERGTPERAGRLKSTKQLLAHFCDAENYKRIIRGIFGVNGSSARIPWGRHYEGGRLIEDDSYIEVPGNMSKLVVSEGIASYLLGNIAKIDGVDHASAFVYADPTDTTLNGTLRDVEEGRIKPGEEKQRLAERQRELELVLPVMTAALKRATIVVDNRERLKWRLGQRNGQIIQ